MTSSSDQEAASVVCQVVQSNLRDAGIGCDIQIQDSGTFFTLGGEVQTSREIFYTGFSSMPDPFWSMVWFTCAQVGQWNFASYCDKDFDRMSREATQTLVPAERTKLYVEMQKRWDEACNAVWVTWPTVSYAGSEKLRPSIRLDGRMLPWDFRMADD